MTQSAVWKSKKDSHFTDASRTLKSLRNCAALTFTVNTANQFARDFRLPIRFLSPNTVTSIHQTGHVINSTAVEEGIKLFRSYWRETLDGTGHRQTAEDRQRTRERCDDRISLPSGFILPLLRTPRPSDEQAGRTWNRRGTVGLGQCETKRRPANAAKPTNGRECIKSHLNHGHIVYSGIHQMSMPEH